MRNFNIKFIIFSLMLAGFGVMYAKVTQLGLPLLPSQESSVWAVEAKLEFTGTGGPAVVNFELPDKDRNFMRIDEFFISSDYGLTIENSDGNRRAEWSTRRASGSQRLFYQIEVVPPQGVDSKNNKAVNDKTKPPLPPEKPNYEEPLASAIEGILSDVREKSADVFTFVSQLLDKVNASVPGENVDVIRQGVFENEVKWVQRIIYVLEGARIPARMVRGVILEDGQINIDLIPWLEIHNGERWQGFNPLTGDKGYPDNFLRWSVGSDPLLLVNNVRNETVKFSVGRRPLELTDIAHKRGEASESILSAISLSRLPLGSQNVYRILLMIPIGALMIVFMRTLVGIPTFGTFMPILIALAFRETELIWGIGLFCFIVGAGLSFRFYLERLHLLLVPRLSAVLVMVILLMLGISLVSSEFSLTRGFSIALFPIVILTMVIERMSIVWEETGPGDAMKQSAGSLFVAIAGYIIMNNPVLEHLVFIFPELLLIVLALSIALGRYNGYRLTELWRFRDMLLEDKKKDV